MDNQNLKLTPIKADFLERMTKKGMFNYMIVLRERDLSYRELKEFGAKRNDKLPDFLGLTYKYKDEYGKVMYGLTDNGRKFAKKLYELVEIMDEILPA